MRVLVTGSRHGFDNNRLYEILDELLNEAIRCEDPMTVIQGGARGVDAQAEEWSLKRRIECVEFPAQWETQGKRAGPMRNIQMLEEGKPDLVVAFHRHLESSKGTKHMVSIAQKAGVDTMVISE